MMAKVVVQTDDGREVWRMEQIEPWHVTSIISGAFTNRVCRALVSGIHRAVRDASVIQAGRDPELRSERIMRLMDEEERRRVSDQSYTPTVEEALRHPDAFVEGMNEEKGDDAA